MVLRRTLGWNDVLRPPVAPPVSLAKKTAPRPTMAPSSAAITGGGASSASTFSLRSFISPNQDVSSAARWTRGKDRSLNLGARSQTPLSHTLFEAKDPGNNYYDSNGGGCNGDGPAAAPIPLPLDVYEMHSKANWMDIGAGWCHLCQEPLGRNPGLHTSDRDHLCLGYFAHLYANYPRHWLGMGRGGETSKKVLDSAAEYYPAVFQYATTYSSMDHLHTVDDARRRSEIEALLFSLSVPGGPASAVDASDDARGGDGSGYSGPRRSSSSESVLLPTLSHVLQNNLDDMWSNAGERLFKAHIMRVTQSQLPPMTNGMITAFTQKCYGRTNGERLYNTLNIDKLIAYHGGSYFPEGKERKTFYMRRLVWEVDQALVKPGINQVTELLLVKLNKRLAFEAMYLQTMQYMNRVHDTMVALDYPSPEELVKMGVT